MTNGLVRLLGISFRVSIRDHSVYIKKIKHRHTELVIFERMLVCECASWLHCFLACHFVTLGKHLARRQSGPPSPGSVLGGCMRSQNGTPCGTSGSA